MGFFKVRQKFWLLPIVLVLLGPEFSDRAIEPVLNRYDAVAERRDFCDLARVVAGKLADGKFVAWFQGRMEFGPQALGNRGLLGARNSDMQTKMNLRIKYRDGFRPFAVGTQQRRGGAFRPGSSVALHASERRPPIG